MVRIKVLDLYREKVFYGEVYISGVSACPQLLKTCQLITSKLSQTFTIPARGELRCHGVGY